MLLVYSDESSIHPSIHPSIHTSVHLSFHTYIHIYFFLQIINSWCRTCILSPFVPESLHVLNAYKSCPKETKLIYLVCWAPQRKLALIHLSAWDALKWQFPVLYCKARKTFSFPFLCWMLLAANLKEARKVESETFQPSLFRLTHPSTEHAPGLMVELNHETILTGKHQAVLKIAPCPADKAFLPESVLRTTFFFP